MLAGAWTGAAYPSGRMLMICFPMIRELLWRMLDIRTWCSEMAISWSKKAFPAARSHAWNGN